MADTRIITVIFNPNAGVGRFKVDEFKLISSIRSRALQMERKIQIDVKKTGSKGDCYDLSRDALGSDVIAVAGGDGTIMEAVNALVGSKTPLGIIPIGSGNDDIVSISGHNDRDRCISDILDGTDHLIDIGRMNDDHFLNVVGLGLDAEINHMVTKERDLVRKIGPALTYTYGAVKVLLRFSPYDVEVSLDGGKKEVHTISLCTIGNGTTCGGGYKLTPRAIMDDGMLDLSISGYLGKIRSIMNIKKAYDGRHVDLPGNRYHTFSEMVITSVDRELPYHIDGEGGYSSRLEFSVVPKGLHIVHGLERSHVV